MSGTYESAAEDVLASHLLLVPVEKLSEASKLLLMHLEDVTHRVEGS